uniref:Uncharacterized protein n=1 Tax=Anguilla anguilla TaxID=7936 RepID=A0A0E9QPX7_ANGAN
MKYGGCQYDPAYCTIEKFRLYMHSNKKVIYVLENKLSFRKMRLVKMF